LGNLQFITYIEEEKLFLFELFINKKITEFAWGGSRCGLFKVFSCY